MTKINSITQTPEAQHVTHPSFTRTCEMSEEKFWNRVKESGKPIQIHSTYVDVFDALGRHLARFNNATNILYYNPDVPITTPPTCDRCQRPMELRRRREDGHFFWGCPNYFDKVVRCKRTVDIAPRVPADVDALQDLLVEQEQSRPRARRRQRRQRQKQARRRWMYESLGAEAQPFSSLELDAYRAQS